MYQKRYLFAHTMHKNAIIYAKISVPLHRNSRRIVFINMIELIKIKRLNN